MAPGVSQVLIIHHFGSQEGLRQACDDYILDTVRASKSEALQSASPTTWFAQLAQIESYAPIMAYLVASMQSGSDLGRTLTRLHKPWRSEDDAFRDEPTVANPAEPLTWVR